MKPIYRKTFTLSDMEVDCFGRLKLSTLLYLAQEVAGNHSELLGAGYNTLAHKGIFWAVTRHRVQITRLPVRGETVTVETWPMPTTRVAYPRSMVAYDAQGKELFRLISLWVLMDANTRAMVLPGKSDVIVEGLLTGSELDAPRSLAPRGMTDTALRTVTYSCLDRNGHMNNTKYLEWIDDLMPSDFHREHTLKEMTICYLAESWEGQQLDMYWDFPENDVMQVDFYRENGEKQERVFSARFQY